MCICPDRQPSYPLTEGDLPDRGSELRRLPPLGVTISNRIPTSSIYIHTLYRFPANIRRADFTTTVDHR